MNTTDLFARIRVLITALPTWLAAATLGLTVVADELVPLLPGGAAVVVAGWIVTALAIIAAVVRTVSRLTPALPSTFGLLPPPRATDRRVGLGDPGRGTPQFLMIVTIVVMLAVIVWALVAGVR